MVKEKKSIQLEFDFELNEQIAITEKVEVNDILIALGTRYLDTKQRKGKRYNHAWKDFLK